jgi:predicted nucleic acid-binding protein
MKPVFLDTGYLIALEASDDQNHAAARQHWRGFSRRLPKLVTTSLVLSEVVTFFNTKGQHAKAVELGNMLLESPAVELVHADESLLLSAWDWFQQYSDKSFSLADCASFVVMRQRGLERALTFDRHFIQAGFQKLP